MEMVLAFYILFEVAVYLLFGKYIKKDRAYWAAAVPLLISAAEAGYSEVKSQEQRKKADNLKPSNYVPEAVQEAVGNARTSSTALMPGYDRTIQKLRQSSANSINSATKVSGTPGQIQQQVGDADAREKESLKDLAVANSSYQAGQKQNLNSLLGLKGGYEKSSFDAFSAAKSALLGASNQNQYNAVTKVLEGAASSVPASAFTSGNGDGSTAPVGQGQGAFPAPNQNQNLTPAQRAYINKLLGLDNPVYQGNFNPYTQ